MDAAKLQQAVEYAQANGSAWDFEKDQVRTFGTPLGPLPKQRAATNGIILRHGYIVAEFGDTKPTIRCTASPRVSCPPCAAWRWSGLIKTSTIRSRIIFTTAATIRRTTPRSPGKITSSRKANGKANCGARTRILSGVEQFGNGKRKPRPIHDPGDLLRIQRRPHQPLFLVAAASVRQKGLPEVLKTSIMDPIGASPGMAMGALQQLDRRNRRAVRSARSAAARAGAAAYGSIRRIWRASAC